MAHRDAFAIAANVRFRLKQTFLLEPAKPRERQTLVGRRSLSPEILETTRAQLGIAHSVLDIAVTEISLQRPISPEFSRRIDVYLNEVRPLIAGAKRHDYFWASARGRPMNGGVIYAAVRRRTCNELGFPVNLHRFRHAAATLWSVQDPANARGAKDLLGHELFEPTETFYIMGQSRLAGRALARAIDALRIRESRR